jgi:hypothetical protein
MCCVSVASRSDRHAASSCGKLCCKLAVITVIVCDHDATDTSAQLSIGEQRITMAIDCRTRIDDPTRVTSDDPTICAAERQRARVISPYQRDIAAREQSGGHN